MLESVINSHHKFNELMEKSVSEDVLEVYVNIFWKYM